MKWLKQNVFFLILLISLFLLMNCDNVVKDLTTQTIPVNQTLANKDITAQPTEVKLVDSREIKSSTAKMGKAAVTDFIEIPVGALDLSAFAAILSSQEIAANFRCTLENRGDDQVTFGVYFSASAALSDPWNQASFIASLALNGGATKTVASNADFDQAASTILSNMLSFIVANSGVTTLYVYLTTATLEVDPANEEIDILLTDMSLLLPAFTQIKNTATPADYSNYADKIDEVKNSHMTGSFTNNGTSSVMIQGYVTIGIPSSYPPPVADLILQTTVTSGSTIRFEDAPAAFVSGAEAKLNAAVAALVGGSSIESNIYFISAAPIIATADNIELESNVDVSL